MKHPGETIIYDVRASYAVKDIAGKYGGKALMNSVGHAFIKRRMREEKAIFGGEVTGHYYFRDNFYADNGFIPALLILELMSRRARRWHELLAPLREKYFISGEINTKVGDMSLVPRKLEALAAHRVHRRAARTRSTASRQSSRSGTSTSAARTPSRSPAEPRGDDAGADGGETRRGARVHPELRMGTWLRAQGSSKSIELTVARLGLRLFPEP